MFVWGRYQQNTINSTISVEAKVSRHKLVMKNKVSEQLISNTNTTRGSSAQQSSSSSMAAPTSHWTQEQEEEEEELHDEILLLEAYGV